MSFSMLRCFVVGTLVVVGCGGEAAPPDPIEMEPLFDPDVCRPDVVQPDLVSQGPDGAPLDRRVWIGPGVDPATGAPIVPEGAIVSTTYLQLRTTEEGQAAFRETVGPVVDALMTAPGLVAVSLSGADSCAVVRTLAVWEDEASMYMFVSTPAHGAAITRTPEISRGGSIRMQWVASRASDATWETAAQRLAAHDGPVY